MPDLITLEFLLGFIVGSLFPSLLANLISDYMNPKVLPLLPGYTARKQKEWEDKVQSLRSIANEQLLVTTSISEHRFKGLLDWVAFSVLFIIGSQISLTDMQIRVLGNIPAKSPDYSLYIFGSSGSRVGKLRG
jgi:hypothetical protein